MTALALLNPEPQGHFDAAPKKLHPLRKPENNQRNLRCCLDRKRSFRDDMFDSASPLPPGLPFTLTVAEAAEWLRISKSGVYELVHRGIATDGADGLPIVKLGLDRTWRIPTVAVLRLVGLLEPILDAGRPPPELHRFPPRADSGAA